MDVWYVDNRSLWLDWRSVPDDLTIFKRDGIIARERKAVAESFEGKEKENKGMVSFAVDVVALISLFLYFLYVNKPIDNIKADAFFNQLQFHVDGDGNLNRAMTIIQKQNMGRHLQSLVGLDNIGYADVERLVCLMRRNEAAPFSDLIYAALIDEATGCEASLSRWGGVVLICFVGSAGLWAISTNELGNVLLGGLYFFGSAFLGAIWMKKNRISRMTKKYPIPEVA